MARVLVVDDDDALRRAWVRLLAHHGHDVIDAGDAETAIEKLARGDVDVVVTDLRLGSTGGGSAPSSHGSESHGAPLPPRRGGSGMEVLEYVHQNGLRARGVLISAYLRPEDYDAAFERGAVRVLGKPAEKDALLEAVEHAAGCESGFHGSVHGLSLIDMLQMFHYGRRVAAIHVSGRSHGTIVIDDGEIVDASFGDLTGTDALRALLGRPWGVIRTTPYVGRRRRTIDVPFQALLLDLLREIDEEDGSSGLDLDEAFTTHDERGAVSGPPTADGPGDSARARIAELVKSTVRLPEVLTALAEEDGAVSELHRDGNETTHPFDSNDLSGVGRALEAHVMRARSLHWIERATTRAAFALLPFEGENILLATPILSPLALHRFRTALFRLHEKLREEAALPSVTPPPVREAATALSGLSQTGERPSWSSMETTAAVARAVDHAYACRMVDLEALEVLFVASGHHDAPEAAWALAADALGGPLARAINQATARPVSTPPPPSRKSAPRRADETEIEVTVAYPGGLLFGVVLRGGRHGAFMAVPRRTNFGVARSRLRTHVVPIFEAAIPPAPTVRLVPQEG